MEDKIVEKIAERSYEKGFKDGVKDYKESLEKEIEKLIPQKDYPKIILNEIGLAEKNIIQKILKLIQGGK